MHVKPKTRVAPAIAALLAWSIVGPSALAGQVERTAALGALSTSFEDLAATVSPAVVQIFASGLSIRRGANARESVVSRQRASGSGVIVDPSGYIVTNAHVVSGATDVLVSIAEAVGDEFGRSILKPQLPLLRARVVGSDPETDIAVLKVERDGLPFVPFGDSDVLQQGELVFAFGSPLGLENSVSMGVVSSVARQLEPEATMIYIQTDAAVNPGNSGGALVDARGRLVGINTLILSRSGGSEGLGFAAPANIVRAVYEQIRESGRVTRGSIGVRTQTVTPMLATGLGLPRQWGVILSDVQPGSPAAQAGLRPGDMLLRLDGKLMENARQFDVNLYRYPPGQQVTLELLRDGAPLALQVTVGQRFEFEDPFAAALSSDRNLIQELGIFAVDLSRVLHLVPNPRSRRGVVVAAFTQNSLGTESPFRIGDAILALNGQPVADVEGLKLALAGFQQGDALVFHVQRSGHLRYVAVEVGW